MFVEVFLGDVLQWDKLVDAGVVNEDIELAEGLLGFGKETFNVHLPSYVCPHCDRFSALFCNFVHDTIRSLLAGGIVNDHCGTFGSEMFGDRSPDAL